MIAIELTKQAESVRKELLNRGFILVKRSGVEVLQMDPALTIREQDVNLFLKTFNQIIQNIENKIYCCHANPDNDSIYLLESLQPYYVSIKNKTEINEILRKIIEMIG